MLTHFFDHVTDSNGNPRPFVNSKGKRRRPSSKTLSSALGCQDEVFLDFISRCLHWDPEKRMKPDEGLMHEWITEVKLNVSISRYTYILYICTNTIYVCLFINKFLNFLDEELFHEL